VRRLRGIVKLTTGPFGLELDGGDCAVTSFICDPRRNLIHRQLSETPLGLTCKHVFGDLSPGRLLITQDKYGTKGNMPAPVKSLWYPSVPRDAAVDGNVVAKCAIEFADDISSNSFRGSPYIIDDKPLAQAPLGTSCTLPVFSKTRR
jgi:hypothetical protein